MGNDRPQGEPRSGTPVAHADATYITYWFKRPIEESADMRDVLDHEKPKYTMDQLLAEEAIAAVAVARGQTTAFPLMLAMPEFQSGMSAERSAFRASRISSWPPETFNLTVVIDDLTKILRIMSEAGWYVKDVTRDRKVDGVFVTYTFTKRNKSEQKLWPKFPHIAG